MRTIGRQWLRGISRIFLGCLLASGGVRGATVVEQLRCEGLENPQGIDAAKPQLSWQIQSEERGAKQTACQILVASSAEKLAQNKGDLWDSGRFETDQSVRMPYAGKVLNSRAECFWKVRVWDADKKPTVWSAPARWSMGLLVPEDWKGAWISASKWFAPNGYGWANIGSAKDDSAAWIRVDLGQAFPIEKVKLVAQSPGAFPVRFRIEAGDDFEFDASQTIADQSAADYASTPGGAAEFPVHGLKARYVRLYVIKSPRSKLHSDIAAAEAAKKAKTSPPSAQATQGPSTDRYQTIR